MAGGVASALAAASRRGGRALDRRPRPVRGRRVLARAGRRRAARRARCCSPTCSATSSTATASSRRSPTAGPTSSPRAPARPRSCSTRTTRWSPTSAASASRAYFGVEDDALAHAELQHAADSKHCRRCGHPYVYDAIYLAHLGRYHCPNCGHAAARAGRRGTRRRAARDPLGRVHARHARRVARASSCRCPASTTSTTRSARRRCALRARRAARRGRRGPGGASRPRSGGRRRSTSAGRPTSILLVKNPAGANEVLRTLALEGEQLDLFGVLNDNTADGRDVSWVWDADWELLAPSVRRMTCSGTRAAELALRMKYAGRRGRPAGGRPGAGRRARRRARRRRRPALRAAHLHGAARAARPARPARPGRGALAMSFAPLVVWHDVECGHYGADLALWDELAAREPGPVLDVGAGTGRVALALAAPATTSPRSTASPSCSPRWPRGRAAEAGCATVVADAEAFALDRRVRADPRADADDPVAARARRLLRRRARAPRAGRAAGDRDRRRARGLRRAGRPPPPIGAARRLALRVPARRGARAGRGDADRAAPDHGRARTAR